MGIEFREGSLSIAPKATAVVKKGMVFNVCVGLSSLTNKESKESEGKTYSLFVGDTVMVDEKGKPGMVLTSSKKRIKNVAIVLKEEEDEESDASEEAVTQKSSKKTDEILGRGARRNNAIIESKLRTEASSEEKRQLNQKVLAERLNEDAKNRLANQGDKKVRQALLLRVTSLTGLEFSFVFNSICSL